MILGIDASNIRSGGGLTHLVELLRYADPTAHGFSKVIVWGNYQTLSKLDARPWLQKEHAPALDGKLYRRILWQVFKLSLLVQHHGCDVLFVPGGSYAGSFRPFVTMSQNLLPFEWGELRRYGFSWMTLKLVLLYISQSRSFRRSDGLVFLTDYARRVVMRRIGSSPARQAVIAHGIHDDFRSSPRKQLPIEHYTPQNPFRLVYVSIVDVYKHQWHIAKAVAYLRQQGVPVVLELIGPSYGPALKRLELTLHTLGEHRDCVRYLGPMPYQRLADHCKTADAFVFASSCENMPNIVLEAMALGLPIACSNKGPMPEMLGDGGLYFDPENVSEISKALHKLMTSPQLRSELALISSKRSEQWTWTRCAEETLSFLAECRELEYAKV